MDADALQRVHDGGDWQWTSLHPYDEGGQDDDAHAGEDAAHHAEALGAGDLEQSSPIMR